MNTQTWTDDIRIVRGLCHAGFGAIGTMKSATFARARNLAIGIGIQNFPEGLAVSLPLHRAGYVRTTMECVVTCMRCALQVDEGIFDTELF